MEGNNELGNIFQKMRVCQTVNVNESFARKLLFSLLLLKAGKIHAKINIFQCHTLFLNGVKPYFNMWNFDMFTLLK